MKEFRHLDYINTLSINKKPQNEWNSFGSGESIVDIGASIEDEVTNEITMVSIEDEWEILENAKKYGLVYLLGNSGVIASKDSSSFKIFTLNYAYEFLQRNCRKGQASMEIPHKNILQV